MTSPRPSLDVHAAHTRLLTAEQVADALQTSTRTVRRLINIGELQAVRIGRLVRIHPVALDAYLGKATGGDRTGK